MITQKSVIIGVDVHKYSHTAVALDSFGQEKGRMEFSNDSLLDYATWLLSFGKKEDIIVALEDVNRYGIHIVEDLRKQGFSMRYVPAILTERERKKSTRRHKSDYQDAKRVGKVILSKYEETLPARESIANENELKISQSLDLLLMERRDLVKQKTVLKNQLHSFLHQYYGDHYADKFKKVFHQEAINFFKKDLSENTIETKEILASGIIRRLVRLELTERQIEDISEEIKQTSSFSKEIVALEEGIHGCGNITAASIMAEITTIKRFKSKDKFAMYAGVSPREHSSGRKNKMYTNPFGNRQLNRAIHSIALSQIACKGDPQGKEYYQKKLKEGKTKLWALRCLKRQVANKIFKILKKQG
jgi:transposase